MSMSWRRSRLRHWITLPLHLGSDRSIIAGTSSVYSLAETKGAYEGVPLAPCPQVLYCLHLHYSLLNCRQLLKEKKESEFAKLLEEEEEERSKLSVRLELFLSVVFKLILIQNVKAHFFHHLEIFSFTFCKTVHHNLQDVALALERMCPTAAKLKLFVFLQFQDHLFHVKSGA